MLKKMIIIGLSLFAMPVFAQTTEGIGREKAKNEKTIMVKRIQLTDDRFEEIVLKSELPVMVVFDASWCSPCKKLEPVIEELQTEYESKVTVVYCDVEECPRTTENFGILNIPTILYFKDGQLVNKSIGVAPKQALKEKIEKSF